MSKKLAVLLVLQVTVGCRSGGQTDPYAAHPQPAAAPIAPAVASGEPASPFSFQQVMRFAKYLTPGAGGTGVVPKEVVQLTGTLNTAVRQAAELRTDDPPQVTAQKAESLLNTLRPWDLLMSNLQSSGVLTAETAQPLQAIVEQLRARTINLIQFGARPETIAEIRQLAAQLRAAGATLSALFSPDPVLRG